MKSSGSELNLANKLKSMSPGLFTDLQTIEKFCEKVWKSILLPWFTNHDADHSRELIVILDQLLKPLVDSPAFLSEHELFVLLSSAYLHDIGMQFLKNESISIEKLTEQEYNYVRKKHAELSSEIIFKRTGGSIDRDDFSLPYLDDEYIAPIALICKAHSTEYFVEVIKQLQEERYTPKGRPFRGELLAALLLIADELDLQCKRVNFQETAKFNLSVHSQVHWYKHHYVDYVGISDNVVEVTLRFPINSEEYRPILKDLIEAKLIDQINMVNPYLQKNTRGLISLNDQVRFTQLLDSHNVKRLLPLEVLIDLRRVMGSSNRPTSIKQIEPNNGRCLSERLQRDIETLQISNDIRESISLILNHSEFPEMMSISGKVVNNPIWKEEGPSGTRREMIDKYRLDGLSAPLVLHLDMMLICCNDARGIGLIYTYYSGHEWGYLINHRLRSPEEDLNRRQEINAADLAKYLRVPVEHILVKPLDNKYAVSVKEHAEHKDLVIYIYEFCSVEITDKSFKFSCEETRPLTRIVHNGYWFYLRTLRSNKTSRFRNGDVIRALQVLFNDNLGLLPALRT